MPTPQTMADVLAANALAASDSPALASIDAAEVTWQTWGDLNRRVDRLAAELSTGGAGSGDRVLLCGPNSVDWCVADLAIARAGCVSVPIHAATPAEQRVSLARVVGAKLQIEGGAVARTGVPDAGSCGPDGLATIVFTSGTSGEPRGVMLTHANLLSNATALSKAVSSAAEAPGDEVRLCMLPLSHLYARTCDLYTWLVRRSKLVLAESRETIFRDCQIARPTAINSVPYFYQKVYERVVTEWTPANQLTPRALLGGAVSHCYCGGAPLAPELEATFDEVNLPLMSGYGLTEASPVATASSIEARRIGAVGRPLPDVQVQLADDGEVLVAGPGVMAGYWRDEPATRAAISDGWLHTGDLGGWTDDGFLTITGRKKEVIVLSTGKKGSPAAIEADLAASFLIEQAIVVGEGRPFLTALIVPNPKLLRALIRKDRLWVWSKTGALRHPKVREVYAREIARRSVSANIGEFTLIGRGFSQDLGEMTPKLSLRRGVIAENFSKEIDAMYVAKPTRAGRH